MEDPIRPKENNECNQSSGDELSRAETIDGMDVAVPSCDLEGVPELQEIQDDVEEASREENEEAEAQREHQARRGKSRSRSIAEFIVLTGLGVHTVYADRPKTTATAPSRESWRSPPWCGSRWIIAT